MHPLAQELNKRLAGGPADRLLSDLGRRMYFPRGIVAQSMQAGERAWRFNATVGLAQEAREPMILPALSESLPGIPPSDSVDYAPTAGLPALRNAWQEEILMKNPDCTGGTIGHPVVTPGLTAGISQVADLFVDPGDVVVLPDLFWGNYRLIFAERRQATLHAFPFFTAGGGFNVAGLSEILQKIGDGKKSVVILNFPNNPTGYSPTKEEASAILEALTSRADTGPVLAICDDAYFGLTYEDECFSQSLFGPLAGAHDSLLAVKVDGATKEEFAWGLRVGFLTFGGRGLGETAAEALSTKVVGNLRATISNSSNLSQHLVLRLLMHPAHEEQKRAAREELERRYRRVLEIVAGMPRGIGLSPLPFNSGYFMSFRCTPFKAEELRLRLLDRGVGTISLGEDVLRVAYAAVDIDLLQEIYAAIFDEAGILRRLSA